jgi:hypothetical protein
MLASAPARASRLTSHVNASPRACAIRQSTEIQILNQHKNYLSIEKIIGLVAIYRKFEVSQSFVNFDESLQL